MRIIVCEGCIVTRQKRPTMNDVARLAGVSQATVSFVMNGKTDGGVQISASTIKRVLDAAATLNYQRNDAALALVTGRFHSIQLLISDVTDPFFDEFIHGVEVEAMRGGYRVYLRSTHFSRKLERTSLADMKNSMVDGVIMCGTQLPDVERVKISRANRVVFINDEPNDYGSGIVVNDASGFGKAMEFLSESGSQVVGFVSASTSRLTSLNRYEAFKSAALDHGHRILDTGVAVQDVSLDFPENELDRVEQLVGRVHNLFCFNDVVAVALMQGLQARGISIPDDVGVIGFDGITLSRVVVPSLTTIEVPRFDLGRRAMLMLASMIGSDAPYTHETIEPTFLPRHSHKAD